MIFHDAASFKSSNSWKVEKKLKRRRKHLTRASLATRLHSLTGSGSDIVLRASCNRGNTRGSGIPQRSLRSKARSRRSVLSTPTALAVTASSSCLTTVHAGRVAALGKWSGWFRIRQSSQAITGNTSDIRPADAGRMFFWRPSFRADREGEDIPREACGGNDRGLTV